MKTFYFQAAVKSFESKEAADGKKSVRIKGYASTPTVDRYNEIVEPTAFQDSLPAFLQKNPVMLRSHKADVPCGKWDMGQLDASGLYVEGEVTEEKTVDDVVAGRMRTLSIGFIPTSTEFRHKDGRAYDPLKDSPWDDDIVRVIKALDLVEISIVSTPANPDAVFTLSQSVKSIFREMINKGLNLGEKDAEAGEVPSNETDPGAAAETPEPVEAAPAAAEAPKAEETPAPEPAKEPEAPQPAAEEPKPADEPKPEEPKADPAPENTDQPVEEPKPPKADDAGAETPQPVEAAPKQEETPAPAPAEPEPAKTDEATPGEGMKKLASILAEVKDLRAETKAEAIDPALAEFIVKLSEYAASEHDRAETLAANAKRSLKVAGQFEPPKDLTGAPAEEKSAVDLFFANIINKMKN